MNRKWAVYAGLGLFLFTGIAATRGPQSEGDPDWQRLRVIPKSISEYDMDMVMTRFNRALGISCNYCHARTKPGVIPVRADFPSDEKPEKRKAREMMQMTDRLNKKYFNYKNLYDLSSRSNAPITCNTCHRGQRKPINRLTFDPPSEKSDSNN